MSENYFKGTFVNEKGHKVTKESRSPSKSATQLRKETIDKQKEKGYKYKHGSLGSKN